MFSPHFFQRTHPRLQHEVPRLFRFLLIGGLSFCVSTGAYALLSRSLFPSTDRTTLFTIVTIVVTWLNYQANHRITFNDGKKQGALLRFALVAFIATILNSTLFFLIHVILGINDFLTIMITTILIAFFTFTSHRFFTFHTEPYRWFKTSKNEPHATIEP